MHTFFSDSWNYLISNMGVFAGNSIGYLRLGCNLDWVDDYDILVFDEDIDKVNLLVKSMVLYINGFVYKSRGDSGIKVFNSKRNPTAHYFHCDIFFSVIKDKKVYNRESWGLYHLKNMPEEVVLPFKKIKMGEIELYGVNNPSEEVKLCYGDIEKGVLYSHDLDSKIEVEDWKTIHMFFSVKREEGIQNIQAILLEHTYLNKLTIYESDNFDSFIE